MWGGGFTHHGEGAFLLLAGCRDTHSPSLCLFPELLRAELWEVGSVIKAYSDGHRMEDGAEANACGLRLQKGIPLNIHVRVTSAAGIVREYLIDRWE